MVGSVKTFEVFAVADGFSVVDRSTGQVLRQAKDDPLAAVVDAALALGLPAMRVLFNRHGDPVQPVGAVIRMEASDGGGQPARMNPVQLRDAVAKRQARRPKGGVRGPREFGPRPEGVAQLPQRYTPEKEELLRQVYGAYWRSPEMEADCARIYGSKPPGYWGAKLDERIAACWADVRAAGGSSGAAGW
jgi:hypothetical protein